MTKLDGVPFSSTFTIFTKVIVERESERASLLKVSQRVEFRGFNIMQAITRSQAQDELKDTYNILVEILNGKREYKPEQELKPGEMRKNEKTG